MLTLKTLWGLFLRLFQARVAEQAESREDFVVINNAVQRQLENLTERLERAEATGDANRTTVEQLRTDVWTLRQENTELRVKLAQCEERHGADQVRIQDLETSGRLASEKIAELERRLGRQREFPLT